MQKDHPAIATSLSVFLARVVTYDKSGICVSIWQRGAEEAVVHIVRTQKSSPDLLTPTTAPLQVTSTFHRRDTASFTIQLADVEAFRGAIVHLFNEITSALQLT